MVDGFEVRVYGVGNVKRFRGGLVFNEYRLFYHSTLDLRVIKKTKKVYEVIASVSSTVSLPCGFGGQGSGEVEGFRRRVQRLRFRVSGFGLGVWGVGCRVQGVKGVGCRVQCSGCRV